MDFRTKFTKWYHRKGYTIDPRRSEMFYICPWWVKPIAGCFFSPSVFFHEELDSIRMRLEEIKCETE